MTLTYFKEDIYSKTKSKYGKSTQKRNLHSQLQNGVEISKKQSKIRRRSSNQLLLRLKK